MQPPCPDFPHSSALQVLSLAVLGALESSEHPLAYAHPVLLLTLTRSGRGWHYVCVLGHRSWSQKFLGLHRVAIPGSRTTFQASSLPSLLGISAYCTHAFP